MPYRKAPYKRKAKGTDKWRPIFLVHAYRMLKAGMFEKDVHERLPGGGVSHETWNQWKKARPELAEAVRMARADAAEIGTLADYCHGRLPPGLREVWGRLVEAEKEPNGVAAVDALLADHGEAARQRLFLQALVASDFSPSRAMQRVGVNRRQVRRWQENDPDFAALVEEMEYHKKNFFEECLVRAAEQGDTAAIVFANKTLNRDRGYGTQVKVDVNHTGTVTHEVFDFAEIAGMLSDSARLELLGALQRREESRVMALPAPERTEAENMAHRIAREADDGGADDGDFGPKPGRVRANPVEGGAGLPAG